MEWYCLVFNSGEVSSSVGASVVYERICMGDFSLVGDIDIIDNLCVELSEKKLNIEINKGPGFIVIGCYLKDAEFINENIKKMAKRYGVSYFEPQNMEYQF